MMNVSESTLDVWHNIKPLRFCSFFFRFDKVIALREEALNFARKIDSDYILFVDSDNFLHNQNGKRRKRMKSIDKKTWSMFLAN